MIKKLINEQYGLDALEISSILTGVGGLTYLLETATGKYILKCVDKNDVYVRNEPEIADYLKQYSVPVADYIKTKDTNYLWHYDNKSYHLQRFVEGEILAFNQAPDWFMAQSAQMLGKIHSALSKFRPLPTGMGEGFTNFMRSGNPKTSYEKTLEKAKTIKTLTLCMMLNIGFHKLIN